MANERIDVPRFSGDEDEYCIWWVRAKAYAARLGFRSAMSDAAEADLPANAGPGVGADEIAAVERNSKAVSFLTAAMPNNLVVNVTAAGESDPNWPDQAKAHLMIAYLKNNFEDRSALSRVGAKRDLESCKMGKEDNPKVLFDKLVAVKFKHVGNWQANITEDDLFAQAIQALPSIYNSTVAGLIDAERRAGRDVTIAALKQSVADYYSIAMKGKNPSKTKDIEGGLAAMDDPVTAQANIKKMIEETIQCTIREYHTGGGSGSNQPIVSSNGQASHNYSGPSGFVGGSNGGGGNVNYGVSSGFGGPIGNVGGMNYVGPGGNVGPSGVPSGFGGPNGNGGGMNYVGQGGNVGPSGMNYVGQGGNVGPNGSSGGMNYGTNGVGVGLNGGGFNGGPSGFGGPNYGGPSGAVNGVTPEIMLAIIQATKAQSKVPGDVSNMLC
jgi:hypothetical protein